MDSKKIQILISAKDSASKVLGNIGDGFDEIGTSADKAQKRTESVTRSLQTTGLILGGIGVGLTAVAKNATDFTVDYVKSVNSLARVTGEAIEPASRLQYVLQRSGVDAGTAQIAFTRFNAQMVEARDKGDAAGTTFDQIGVKVTDSKGKLRGFSDVLLDVADRFKAMPDGADKTTIATDLFGKSARNLLPVLNKGSEGIKQLEADADALGITLSSKNVASIQKYIASTKDMKASTDAVKIAIGTLTAPVLAEANSKMAGFITSVAKSDGPLKTITANVVAFGGPVLTTAGALVGFGANLRTAAAGANIARIAVRGLSAVTSPVGLVLAGVTAVVGVATWAMGRHSKQLQDATVATREQTTVEDELNATMEESAKNIDRVTQAQDLLTSSRFSAEGSALSVERAQRSYNEAVKEYGPQSLEAREAAHNLQEAQNRLTEANDKVRESQEKVQTAEGIFRDSTPSVVGAIDTRIGKYLDLAGVIESTVGKVMHLNEVTLTVVSEVKGNLLNAANTAQNTANTVQQTFNQVQNTGGRMPLTGNPQNAKGFATGTDYVPQTADYLVGERGPERVRLPQGAKVSSASDTAESSRTTITYQIQSVVIQTAEAAREFFSIQDRNSVLASKGMSVVRS